MADADPQPTQPTQPTLSDAIANYIRAGFIPQTSKRKAQREQAWQQLVDVIQSRQPSTDDN